MLDSGTAAPAFALPDQTGTIVSSSDFEGRWVAMWWFPKASTPG